nr:hypothetical protein CFP56_11148 [Quercus suber]
MPKITASRPKSPRARISSCVQAFVARCAFRRPNFSMPASGSRSVVHAEPIYRKGFRGRFISFVFRGPVTGHAVLIIAPGSSLNLVQCHSHIWCQSLRRSFPTHGPESSQSVAAFVVSCSFGQGLEACDSRIAAAVSSAMTARSQTILQEAVPEWFCPP